MLDLAAIVVFAFMILGSLAYIGYQMRALHLSTNSRMDQLLEVTRLSSKAQGNLEGRAEEKLETKG